MSDTHKEAAAGRPNVLARKVAAAKEGAAGLAGALTLKALRRSIARAAADLCDLPVAVLAARQANRAPEDLPEHLSDKNLLVVLDGPNGRIGAATLDAAAVTALIQQQTMGVVMGKAPAERNYTPTDAAMTADFIEKAFAKVVSMLDGQKDLALFQGYRFGAQIEDVRSLLLGMEAEDYRVIELTLDLASGLMQGQMTIILPEPTMADLADGRDGAALGPSLGSNMGNMRAELTAVLCKMRVPLREFARLKAGDVLPLEQAFLYETDLRAISGQSIAQGRLGQLKGARAIRLNEPRTRLVSDLDAGNAGFSTRFGSAEPSGLADEPPAFDLEIAAQGLQEPLDDDGTAAGFGMDGLPALAAPQEGFGGMDAAPFEMGGLGGDSLMGGDGLPDLPEADFSQFNFNDTAAEISELAGLDGGDGN